MDKKILFTIFAGRERYLSILKRYLDKLLNNNLIYEVHLWDFTRNENDTNYIRELCNSNSKYVYMTPKTKKYWGSYYKYYYQSIKDDEILIKCDDDIVYIDINNFKNFIETIKEDTLYFPNIVNNDVCAYFQTQLGIHNLFTNNIYNNVECVKQDIEQNIVYVATLSKWYKDYSKELELHSLFLDNKERFHLNNKSLIDYSKRISINFFGANANTVRKYFKDLSYEGLCDDESYFGYVPTAFQTPHKINLNFTVVHFQFSEQNGKDLDTLFLDEYNNLSYNI